MPCLGAGDQEDTRGTRKSLADVPKSDRAFLGQILSYEAKIKKDAAPCLELCKLRCGYGSCLCIAEIKLCDAFLFGPTPVGVLGF